MAGTNRILRAVASARLSKVKEEQNAPHEAAEHPWLKKPVLDPDGARVGHVSRLAPATGGGEWLVVSAELGAFDWLSRIGGAGGHPSFSVHSNDVEAVETGLRLKRSVLSYYKP